MEVNCKRCGKVINVEKEWHQDWIDVKYHSRCASCKEKEGRAAEKAHKEMDRTFTKRYYHCSRCNGKGEINGYKCTDCKGTGSGPQSNFNEEMDKLNGLLDKYFNQF